MGFGSRIGLQSSEHLFLLPWRIFTLVGASTRTLATVQIEGKAFRDRLPHSRSVRFPRSFVLFLSALHLLRRALNIAKVDMVVSWRAGSTSRSFAREESFGGRSDGRSVHLGRRGNGIGGTGLGGRRVVLMMNERRSVFFLVFVRVIMQDWGMLVRPSSEVEIGRTIYFAGRRRRLSLAGGFAQWTRSRMRRVRGTRQRRAR